MYTYWLRYACSSIFPCFERYFYTRIFEIVEKLCKRKRKKKEKKIDQARCAEGKMREREKEREREREREREEKL